MSEERCCGGGGMLLAFLAGGLIGAGLALLYAPASGKETRQKINDMAGDLRRKAEGWSGDMKEKVASFIEEEKSVVKAAYDAGRDAMAKERAKYEGPK